MKTRQHHLLDKQWIDYQSDINTENTQLVLAFGAPEKIADPDVLGHLRSLYPKADIMMASTAGEILNGRVYDNSVVATAIQLEKTALRIVQTNISEHGSGSDAGKFLFEHLKDEKLCGIFLLSDGTQVSGDDLLDGLRAVNVSNIPITGGMAGDGVHFQKTVTGLNAAPGQGNIIAVGFYGDHFVIGHGSGGGWTEFGLERTITRSEQNKLQELDQLNALDIYKRYLGDYANELPGSALMFPLAMRVKGTDKMLIRTVLAVDNEEGGMIFAGNVPKGNTVKLMRGDFDSLIDATAEAARHSLEVADHHKPDLTLMVSCVGRKIVLSGRVWEEIQNAHEVLGETTKVFGFYSYGCISPVFKRTSSELHNQTMSLTTFTEL